MVYKDGRWTMDFEMKVKPTSTDTVNLSKHPYYVVLLVKGGQMKSGGQLGPLMTKKLPYSANLISFVNPGSALKHAITHLHRSISISIA